MKKHILISWNNKKTATDFDRIESNLNFLDLVYSSRCTRQFWKEALGWPHWEKQTNPHLLKCYECRLLPSLYAYNSCVTGVLKLLLHNSLIKKISVLKKQIIPTKLTRLRSWFAYVKTDGFRRFGNCLFIIVYAIYVFYCSRSVLSQIFLIRVWIFLWKETWKWWCRWMKNWFKYGRILGPVISTFVLVL